jgi:hypothetical protein
MVRAQQYARNVQPGWWQRRIVRKETHRVRDAFMHHLGTVQDCCGPASDLLAERLLRRGIGCEVLWNGFHMWVQVGNCLGDPTAEQFGDPMNGQSLRGYQKPRDTSLHLRTVEFYRQPEAFKENLATMLYHDRRFSSRLPAMEAIITDLLGEKTAADLMKNTVDYAHSLEWWNRIDDARVTYPLL